MASRIATQSDAYNIGGKKPSGYVANKCCTTTIALSCGCDTISGYAMKRLVPENLLKPSITRYTLTLSVQSDEYQYWDATAIVIADGVTLANDLHLGYAPQGNIPLDRQFEIEEGSNVLVSLHSVWYGNSSSMQKYGIINWRAEESDLYPYISITENGTDIDIEFTMDRSRQLIALVTSDPI